MKQTVFLILANENCYTNQKKLLKLHASNRFVTKLHNNTDIYRNIKLNNHKNICWENSPQEKNLPLSLCELLLLQLFKKHT